MHDLTKIMSIPLLNVYIDLSDDDCGIEDNASEQSISMVCDFGGDPENEVASDQVDLIQAALEHLHRTIRDARVAIIQSAIADANAT